MRESVVPAGPWRAIWHSSNRICGMHSIQALCILVESSWIWQPWWPIKRSNSHLSEKEKRDPGQCCEEESWSHSNPGAPRKDFWNSIPDGKLLSSEGKIIYRIYFSPMQGMKAEQKLEKHQWQIDEHYPKTLERLKLKLRLQYFGHLMGTANSLEKTLRLGKIEGKRRRRWQRMR